MQQALLCNVFLKVMNIITYLKESHRWQHLSGGLLSLGCWYAALLAGVGIASALEYKDKHWDGKWDWIDWVITIAGVAGGFGISLIIKTFLL